MDPADAPDLLQFHKLTTSLGEVTTPEGEAVRMIKLHLHVWEERVGSQPRQASLPAVWMRGEDAWALADALAIALTQHGFARPPRSPDAPVQ